MKRPPVASLDEVKITRSGNAAIIEYADETVATTHFELGPEVEHLTDREILERWNECVEARELSWAEFGRLLTTYAGWGMRIVFVPDDDLHEIPRIEIREPDE